MRILLAVLICGGLCGQDKNQAQMRTRTEVGTNVKNAVVDFYDSVSDYYRQSYRAVQAISKKGIPDEEIPAVLFIARKSSASPNQVVEARKNGTSWNDIAKQHKVDVSGDVVTYANVTFLSEYHGRKAEEIQALRAKGASFIDINQEYRRESAPPVTGRKTR